MRQVVGWGDALGVGDGNAIKYGCDDHCNTIKKKNKTATKKKRITHHVQSPNQTHNEISVHTC